MISQKHPLGKNFQTTNKNDQLLNLKFWGYETSPAIYPKLLTMITLLNLVEDKCFEISGKLVRILSKDREPCSSPSFGPYSTYPLFL